MLGKLKNDQIIFEKLANNYVENLNVLFWNKSSASYIQQLKSKKTNERIMMILNYSYLFMLGESKNNQYLVEKMKLAICIWKIRPVMTIYLQKSRQKSSIALATVPFKVQKFRFESHIWENLDIYQFRFWLLSLFSSKLFLLTFITGIGINKLNNLCIKSS